MIIHRDIEQGTEEWKLIRAGRPTSSEFSRIITTKGEPSKSRVAYMRELAGERLSGVPRPTFQSYDMKWGTKYEPEARRVFAMKNKVMVEQVGFCTSDDGRYGFSPDGLITEKREGAEFKCPKAETQIDRIENGWKIKSPYFQQVQGGLLVSGYERWHCFSYYPGMKSVHVIVEPDRDFHIALTVELEKFCNELEELTEKLRSK